MPLSVIDLEVAEYWLRKGGSQQAVISQVVNDSGESKWKIMIQDTYVLGKDGTIMFEPRPSNRTEDFFKTYRYSSAQEALDVWNKFAPALDENNLSAFT